MCLSWEWSPRLLCNTGLCISLFALFTFYPLLVICMHILSLPPDRKLTLARTVFYTFSTIPSLRICHSQRSTNICWTESRQHYLFWARPSSSAKVIVFRKANIYFPLSNSLPSSLYLVSYVFHLYPEEYGSQKTRIQGKMRQRGMRSIEFCKRQQGLRPRNSADGTIATPQFICL